MPNNTDPAAHRPERVATRADWSTPLRRRWILVAGGAPLVPAAMLATTDPRGVELVVLAAFVAASPLLTWSGTRSTAAVSGDGVLSVRSFLHTDPPLRLASVRIVDRRFPFEHHRRQGGLLLATDARTTRLPLGWWRDEDELLSRIQSFLPERVEVVAEADLPTPDIAGAATAALRELRTSAVGDQQRSERLRRLADATNLERDTEPQPDEAEPPLRLTPVAARTLRYPLGPADAERARRQLRRRFVGTVLAPAAGALAFIAALLAAAWWL
jgi:hypothetical protein